MKAFITLHLTVLRERLPLIFVGGFLLTMLTIVFSFAGWLDDLRNAIYSGWCLLLLWNYVGIYLLAAQDQGRCDTFQAMGLLPNWCRAEMLVHIGFSAVFILVWNIVLVLKSLPFQEIAIHDAAMFIFSIVSAQAVFVNLQPNLSSLPEAKKMALYAVISAPWNLTAWIFGLFASKSCLSHTNPWIFITAATILGILQYAMGSFLNDEDRNR